MTALPLSFHLALAGAIVASAASRLAVAETAAAPPAGPAVWFVEATREAGIDFVHVNGGTVPIVIYEEIVPGAAIFDFDGDGDLDLFLVQSGARRFPLPEGLERPTHRLYRNEGAGPDGTPRFVDATAAAGVTGRGYGTGAVAADIDNDGDQDLYVTAYGPNQLFVNRGDGTFSDGTAAAGVGDDRMSLSAVFGDIDRDGRVDLFVANYVDYLKGPEFCTYNGIKSGCSDKEYPGLPDSLYLNLGVGEDGLPRFRDVARERGVEDPLGRGMGSLFADLDSDGDSDLYVANDGGSNRLFLNDGSGRFKDFTLMSGSGHSEAGLGEASMGTDAGDYDNDGDLDLIVTNFARETEALYRNDGAAMFDYATAAAGMAQSSYLPLSWGTQFFDADLDGDLDLYVVNGHVYDVCNLINPQDHFEQPDQFYLNDGTGSFKDISAQAGPGLAIAASGRGAAFGDLDDDGDVDLYVANDGARGNLLLNRTPRGSRHWVRLTAVGSASNHDALGARLLVTTGGRRQLREVKSGTAYLSHSDIRPVVGLGDATQVDRLEVRWPSGARQSYENLAADHDYRFTEIRR